MVAPGAHFEAQGSLQRIVEMGAQEIIARVDAHGVWARSPLLPRALTIDACGDDLPVFQRDNCRDVIRVPLKDRLAGTCSRGDRSTALISQCTWNDLDLGQRAIKAASSCHLVAAAGGVAPGQPR